jgi:putative selenium metabolism protein SsnA
MLVLKNASILQFYPSKLESGLDIIIDEGLIKEVGPNVALKYINIKDSKTIDLNGKIITPGLVCAHTHCYSTLSRGMQVELGPNPDFITILKKLWWRLDRAIREEILYYSALVSAIEALFSGTTALIDHHASPNYISNSLSIIGDAFEEVGLRGILAYEITCRNNGIKEAQKGLEENIDFINRIKNKNQTLLTGAIGGHASFTLSDDALKIIGNALQEGETGFHVHVAEDTYDVAYTHHYHGLNIMRRFDNFGLINNRAIFAHGVHLSDEDINIINQYDAFLIHNARSNMNNAVGYNCSLSKINNVALGTDGIGFNMFEEAKFAYFKSAELHSKIGTNILKHLTNGNIILERYFKKPFGKIEKGYMADLTILNYLDPTPITEENILGHFIFGMTAKDVKSVIVNGELLLDGGELNKNLTEIYSNAKRKAKELWDRTKELD